jgi:acetate kinase
VSSTKLLSLNVGSSSIRFAVYDAPGLQEGIRGKLDCLHGIAPTLNFKESPDAPRRNRPIAIAPRASAAVPFIDWLASEGILGSVSVVGHRIVHGMDCVGPASIDERLLERLRAISVHDRQHLPLALDVIEAIRRRRAGIPQVACFDTSFHRTMPSVAKILPIPRRFQDHGLRRYGFHGLSYGYVLEELDRLDGAAVAWGRVVLAHLGNGSSLAAVKNGLCIDTTMGFTPTGGLPMGSRSGDLDPGVVFAMARAENLSLEAIEKVLEAESGLIGVSATSSDLRELIRLQESDSRAAQAIAMYCYQARKGIGAFAAALGGLDTLVFTGGIGENAASIRAGICEGLAFLGLSLDEAWNASDARVISSKNSRVTVRVIPTDEERMIARETWRLHGGERSRSCDSVDVRKSAMAVCDR